MSHICTDLSDDAVASSGVRGSGCGWEDHVLVLSAGDLRVWWCMSWGMEERGSVVVLVVMIAIPS